MQRTFHRRAARHFPSLGATVLAHDDQSRLYLRRGLQNFHRRRPNAGVDGQAVQQRSLASDSDCAIPRLPAQLADLDNVESRSLDLAKHICHRQRPSACFVGH